MKVGYNNNIMEIIYKLKKTKEFVTVPVCSVCLTPFIQLLKKDATEIIKKYTGSYLCKECARKKEGKE